VRASYVTALALGLLVLGRWAHDKPALNVQTVAGGAFAVIVIAALDGGKTQEIARGLAWLLLAAAALSPDSPLTAIARAANARAAGTTAPAGGTRGGPSA
jgi:hypothetical protein